jgi:hypothetical protein
LGFHKNQLEDFLSEEDSLQQGMSEEVKVHFELHIGERIFPLVIRYEHGEFVACVKELMVAKLKSTEPATFGTMAINVSWITLYTSEEHLKSDTPIPTAEMPNQKFFWAKLIIPQGKIGNESPEF